MQPTPPEETPDPIATLGDDIAQAKHAVEGSTEKPLSGSELGFRMVSELVSGVAVGGLLGHWIDEQLSTTPWMFIVCLMFGLAAGVLAMLRTANKAT